MAIPTKEDFLRTKALISEAYEARRRDWDGLAADPRAERPRQMGDEWLARLKTALWAREEGHERHWEEIWAGAVGTWLREQPGFSRAHTLIGRRLERIRKPSPAAALANRNDRVESWFRWVVEEDATWFRLEHWFLYSFIELWPWQLVRALHEYHYTENSKRIVWAAKKGRQELELLDEGLARALQNFKDFPIDHVWSSARRLDDARSALSKLLAAAGDLPFVRDSQLGAEHLFVYRMWIANRRVVRKGKPDVIAELLTIDGFRCEVDMRTIERLCSKWEGARVARLARIAERARQVKEARASNSAVAKKPHSPTAM